eukprot:1953254-Ditylum_brightwellii.AAC.1
MGEDGLSASLGHASRSAGAPASVAPAARSAGAGSVGFPLGMSPPLPLLLLVPLPLWRGGVLGDPSGERPPPVMVVVATPRPVCRRQSLQPLCRPPPLNW